MPFPLLRRLRARRPLALATALGLSAGACGLVAALAAPRALAQSTPSLMEFRWDNTKDYRKLYYFITDSQRLKWAEYYLLLRPKDRKTAILKLTVTVPKHFDTPLEAKNIKLCKMKEGGMLARTRCEKVLPATVEVAKNGQAIDIYPETPIPDKGTYGVYLNLFNPYNIGMYQFNALAQAPGEVPMAGYLGSWLIQIDPPN